MPCVCFATWNPRRNRMDIGHRTYGWMGVHIGPARRWMRLHSLSCWWTCCGAKPNTRWATCNAGGNWWSVLLDSSRGTGRSRCRTAGRKTRAIHLSLLRLKLQDSWQRQTSPIRLKRKNPRLICVRLLIAGTTILSDGATRRIAISLGRSE